MSTTIAYLIIIWGTLIAFLFIWSIAINHPAPKEDCCARADSLASELRWIAVQDSVVQARWEKEYDLILGARIKKMVNDN